MDFYCFSSIQGLCLLNCTTYFNSKFILKYFPIINNSLEFEKNYTKLLTNNVIIYRKILQNFSCIN